MPNPRYAIAVAVATRFLDEQSAPDEGRYVFAYTIRIANTGDVPARLLSRRWLITDANGKVQEVAGEGVVGQQPWLKPGGEFEYTSGAVLRTPVGRMQGSYGWRTDDERKFRSPIPGFLLSMPRVLH